MKSHVGSRIAESLATLAATLGFCASTFAAALAQSDLIAKAITEGSVRVIVQLDTPTHPDGEAALADAQLVSMQRQNIAATQDSVLADLGGTSYSVSRRFRTVPALALQVAADALGALQQSAHVVAIEEDVPVPLALGDSVHIVQADHTANLGFDGTGWVIVILDTGADSAHPFLAGKVVDEACFSGNGNCPNGGTTQFGAGAGAPCTYAPDACQHGTHVSGIAAGLTPQCYVPGLQPPTCGIASGAKLISIQVFSRFTGQVNCGMPPAEDPCARSFPADQMAALEYVFDTLRQRNSISSVNMSLGGGAFLVPCDTNVLKPLVDQLRTATIATVIASGNGAVAMDGSFVPGIASPACISTAVSVGATTKADNIANFSQSAPFLSLLAPGVDITSSVPGGGFASFSGTSMATPHVAGAWAILKQLSPGASVTTVLTTLRATGLNITDARNGVTTPRIKIYDALYALP